ncbi:uncharacterized protein LOC111711442 [Eurytemora carolleeae]|uniref:uncharacterized protein LOC111711442 n=1 Tax=Eurytemora carolleeae TaxID=1294199 RepID=UPI000C76A779|nr:uncharacterized protein LOC111711442 [Eurytemora carolleeae]XP_023341578.1 uncharacterized protein LOC111711442 [Eurytemora carolleeae]|eukprot:XP_023341577.1 uncharacterized protein LOC111711442 [Eurytemora affinis]
MTSYSSLLSALNPSFHLLIVLFILVYSPVPTSQLRCYTDLEANKANSVECGMNTGCLKIYKKAQGFDEENKFIPLEKRGTDIELFRGCFLVSVPDTCYESSTSKLSYCWCSHRDLCNNTGRPAPLGNLKFFVLAIFVFQLVLQFL